MAFKCFAIILLALALCVPVKAQIQTYCSEVDGNIACTSYDSGTSSQTYCSSIAGSLTCTTYRNNNDDHSQAQVERNYEVGQIAGSAIGDSILAAIERHSKNKQARQQWDQFVQDNLAKMELTCETNPDMNEYGGPVGCRTFTFALNQFIHKHRKNFIASKRNLLLLADGLDKVTLPSGDLRFTTEQMFETAFQNIDKKQLSKELR
jgi:hypothetical protein